MDMIENVFSIWMNVSYETNFDRSKDKNRSSVMCQNIYTDNKVTQSN